MPELRYKNIRLFYYIRAVATNYLIPRRLYRARLEKKLRSVTRFDLDYIKQRVNHYNKLTGTQPLSGNAISNGELSKLERPKDYYFDTQEYLRYFSQSLRIRYVWGDVVHVPEEPAIVKSRPIIPDNANAVILKLNKARHFNFISDPNDFQQKKDLLIGRGTVTQPHRVRFYELYFGHPLCNLGQINPQPNPQWLKPRTTIAEHLRYKFILTLEGNDVATNLKWVMSSNSIAVMPAPKFETWFMESRLIPDHHYIHIKDDYSDLEEKLQYYIANTREALRIIHNAHEYISQFRNREREDLISLLCLEKYFYRTGQLMTLNPSLYD